MKIALVSPYDFLHPGGVTNHIAALEREFTKLGHEVKVIAPAARIPSTFGERFIPIGKPRPVPASGSVARVTLSLRLASRIKAVLEQERFDIIHLHEPFMPMLCSAVLRFANVPAIGTFHACNGSPGYNLGWPIGRIMLRRRRHKLLGRIAVSEPARQFAGKYVPGPYEIIPNGVDLGHFSPDVPPVQKFRDGKINIVFVGRLERRKGVKYLLQAFARVKREVPECRLIIVGPGSLLRRRYEMHVVRHRLQDVVFTGLASYDELPAYYSTADIFCSPATGRESFGIVLLEAMAMAKPIVASRIEGYASVLTDGAEGLLVPPGDRDALAQALLRLVRDPALRREMGARGRLKAHQYSWEGIARRVLACYEKVAGNQPAPGVG